MRSVVARCAGLGAVVVLFATPAAAATLALQIPIMSGRVENVRAALEKGADVNAQDDSGNTPLHFATFGWPMPPAARVEIAKLLLAHGAKVDVPAKNGMTPLHMAAAGHDFPVELLELLVAHGADVGKKSDAGTPLELATSAGEPGAMRFLAGKGGAKNGTADPALVKAIIQGDMAGVRKALASGASLAAGSPPPLFYAVAMGDRKIVAALLAKGAKSDATPKKTLIPGFRPIHLAARAGHAEVIDELLDHGAKVDQTADDGMTAFLYAAWNGRVAAMRTLQKRGADIRHTIPGFGGVKQEAFSFARLSGSGDAVRFLVEQGFDPNLPDERGITPLASSYSAGVTVALIEKGATIDEATLGRAIQGGWIDVLDLLVAKGLSLSESGPTFAFTAALDGNAELLEFAIEHGVTVDPDFARTTAQTARQNGHDEIAEILIENWGAASPKERADAAARRLKLQAALPAILEAERAGDADAAAGHAAAAAAHYAGALRDCPARTQPAARIRRKLLEQARKTSLPVPEEVARRLTRAQAFIEKAANPEGFRPAIAELEEAVRQAPWLPEPYFNLGLVQERVGDFSGAIASFKIYLEIAPGSKDAAAVRKKISTLEVDAELAGDKPE